MAIFQAGIPISFNRFFKIGFPMMLVSTTVAMIYLLICHRCVQRWEAILSLLTRVASVLHTSLPGSTPQCHWMELLEHYYPRHVPVARCQE